jgi:hypothetical protein
LSFSVYETNLKGPKNVDQNAATISISIAEVRKNYEKFIFSAVRFSTHHVSDKRMDLLFYQCANPVLLLA